MCVKRTAWMSCLLLMGIFTNEVTAEVTVPYAVQTCLDRGLVHILQGDLSLIDTMFVTMQVAGPRWKTLTEAEQRHLHTTTLSVMERRLKKVVKPTLNRQ